MIPRLDFRVTIDGIETSCTDARTQHGANQPIASGSLTMPAPRPAHVDLAAPVKIEAGYDGAVRTVFDGRIINDQAAFSDQGGSVRVALEGHGKRLWYTNPAVQSIAGPVALHAVFNAFCHARGVPLYWADLATTPTGSTINLGGVSKVDDGKVVVDPSESPGGVLDRLARLFGYRTFDTPTGFHRFCKISGAPVGTPVRHFIEGENVIDVEQTRKLAGMVNYWEVLGASYTANDGSTIAIRSIPATVPNDPRLGPAGVNHKQLKDAALVTQALADTCRNVQEIDYATPQGLWGWTGGGDAELEPGQVVTLTSPTVGGDLDLWLTQVTHTISMRGWTTSYEGWAGSGVPLPSGNDCVTYTLLGSAGKHLGTETLSHYRRPHPDGLAVSIPFTVTDGYSSLTIRGYAHGTNSFTGNTQSTASRFEIWQGGEKVASGEMPRQNENLEWQLNYKSDSTWSPIVVPLSGSLATGGATLRIISGYDNAVGDYDDFEVRSLSLTACGIGQPVVVVGGG